MPSANLLRHRIGFATVMAITTGVTIGTSQAQTPAPAASSERPWYLGLTQDFSRVSNVLSAPSGSEISDTLSTTTLLGGVNTRLGRQRLFADVNLNSLKYRRVDDRDTNGYSLSTGLDWSTVERLSGTVRLGTQQRQTDFGGSGVVQTSLSNVEKTQLFESSVRVGGESLLAFEVATGWRKVRFEAPEFANSGYTQKSASVGLLYRPSGLLSTRFGLRGSRASSQAASARSRNNGAFMGATWIPTGISTVSAELAYENEDSTTVRDGFKGVTGSVSWRWQPSGRISTTTTLSRVTGREAGFVRNVDAPVDPSNPVQEFSATNFSRVTNGLALSVGYALTGKVDLTAGLSSNQRSFGSLAGGGKDRETALSLGARWAALRTVSVGCDVGYNDRNSSGAATTDASSNRFGCNVGLRLD
jgi:hypothetical protein